MTSALNQAELESEHNRPVWFIHLNLAIDPLYACTATRTLSFGGNDYLGIGEIQGISDLTEAADIAARQITINASSVDAYITEPLLSRTNYKNRAAVIYKGFLNENGALVDDPEIKWRGRMDVGSMVMDKEFVAQVTCEPLPALLLRANIPRYSDEDHQTRHPGDKFYEFLTQMEKKDVVWGGSRVSPSTSSGTTGGSSSNPGQRIRLP